MRSSAPVTRAAVVASARGWLGTPYHHQASARGAGCDCIGLVRGVWRELYGAEPEALPGDSRDWAEATGTETLIEAARRHLSEISPAAARPGDVLVFRYRVDTPAKHCAFLALSPSSRPSRREGRGEGAPPVNGALPVTYRMPLPSHAPLTLIHAVEGAPVAEVPLLDWWRRRIAAAFAFPGIID